MLEQELINLVSNGNLSTINIVILGYLFFLHKKISKLENHVCK